MRSRRARGAPAPSGVRATNAAEANHFLKLFSEALKSCPPRSDDVTRQLYVRNALVLQVACGSTDALSVNTTKTQLVANLKDRRFRQNLVDNLEDADDALTVGAGLLVLALSKGDLARTY
jgi:hypothetical protein